MIRSTIFILIFAVLSFSLAPQIANAQNSAVESTTEGPVVHNERNIEASYRKLKRDDAYQFELAEPIPHRPPSAFAKALGRIINAIFSFLAPILEIAFWLGVVGLALGAVYLIGRAIYETRFAKTPKQKEAEPEVPLYQPAEAQARILLEEVDKLAAKGRYGEAVHTLLFRSIQDIDRNRPNVVRRSLTSREIGKLSVLTIKSRTAFSTISGVSELAHFGGVAVNKAGFETARAAYAELTGQTTSSNTRGSRR